MGLQKKTKTLATMTVIRKCHPTKSNLARPFFTMAAPIPSLGLSLSFLIQSDVCPPIVISRQPSPQTFPNSPPARPP
ncbi:hypothetical protein L204_100222 [Cryptococcus depauperatus]